MPVLAGLLGTAAAPTMAAKVLGTVGGALFANKLAQNSNKKLAQHSFNKNVEMWKMQNEYNSPKNQMARYNQAGLNPNLMYDKGTPGNAQTMPQYQSLPSSGEVFGQSVAGLQGLAQTENIKIQAGINRFAKDVAEATKETQIETQKADLKAKTIANTLATFQSAHYQELKTEGVLKEKAYAELESIEKQTRQTNYKNLATKYGFDNAGTGIRMIGYYLVDNRVSATKPDGFTDNEIRTILGIAHAGSETLNILKQVGLALSPRHYIKEFKRTFQ
jgi:hypothetical protein